MSAVTPRITTVSQSSRKFCKCSFTSSFGLPQNGLACTMLMRLDFSSKFTSPTLMSVEERVVLPEWVPVPGEWREVEQREVVPFSQASLDCLCSFPAGRNQSYTTPVFFQIKNKRRHKVTLARKSNDYILSMKPRL